MARAKRTTQAARRHLIRLFVRSTKAEVVALTDLIAALSEFNKNCVEGKTIFSRTMAVPMAASVLQLALPGMLSERTKLLARQQRKLNRK